MFMGAASPASAASPDPVSSSGVAVPAAITPGSVILGYKDQSGQVISLPDSGVHPDLGCTPEGLPDHPHAPSGEDYVGGHGTWKKGTCHNDTAHVYNCLYEYYSDGYFYKKGCSKTVTLRAGESGRGHRSTVHVPCDSKKKSITWSNRIDVDVIGEIDTGDQPTKKKDVHCVKY